MSDFYTIIQKYKNTEKKFLTDNIFSAEYKRVSTF